MWTVAPFHLENGGEVGPCGMATVKPPPCILAVVARKPEQGYWQIACNGAQMSQRIIAPQLASRRVCMG